MRKSKCARADVYVGEFLYEYNYMSELIANTERKLIKEACLSSSLTKNAKSPSEEPNFDTFKICEQSNSINPYETFVLLQK